MLSGIWVPGYDFFFFFWCVQCVCARVCNLFIYFIRKSAASSPGTRPLWQWDLPSRAPTRGNFFLTVLEISIIYTNVWMATRVWWRVNTPLGWFSVSLSDWWGRRRSFIQISIILLPSRQLTRAHQLLSAVINYFWWKWQGYCAITVQHFLRET